MRSLLILISVLAVTVGTYSCSNAVTDVSEGGEKIMQKDDGTINLALEKAACYKDKVNPSGNTAEWSIIVSKPGRYKVWLSSATIDTMHLQYSAPVKISLLDERLDVQPIGDKIVLDASDVKFPYYRADSYMGTFYIQEPGEYSIQIISEKVMEQSENNNTSSFSDHTKLMSVFLTPVTR